MSRDRLMQTIAVTVLIVVTFAAGILARHLLQLWFGIPPRP